MANSNWKTWQNSVVREDYVKPEISDKNRKNRIREVNRKYNPSPYYTMLANKYKHNTSL